MVLEILIITKNILQIRMCDREDDNDTCYGAQMVEINHSYREEARCESLLPFVKESL